MQVALPRQRRIAAGEAAPALPSVGELFQQHAPFVFRVLRRLGVAETEVDDVCQEVFIAVQQALPAFEGRSSVRTWIYAIAVRRAANHARRAFRRYERVTEAPPDGVSECDPTAALERQRARALLDSLLAALDQPKRQVFVLYELEELSMREIAEVVGCPLQTAYGRLHAARRELKRIASERGVTP
jgi:RNA polymerase sigma-70 factor (ECF subfamily)